MHQKKHIKKHTKISFWPISFWPYTSIAPDCYAAFFGFKKIMETFNKKMKRFFACTANLTASSSFKLSSSSISFSIVKSQVKCSLSFFPFDQGLLPAVRDKEMLNLAAASFINGFLNSPPL